MAYYTSLMTDDLEFDEDIVNLATQVPSVVAPSTKNSRRGINFSIEDDKILVSAWLTISKDPTKGNAQSSNRYWERISLYFNDHSKNPRTQPSIKQRWNEINRKCQLFCGFLSQIERKNASGQTMNGRIEEAKQMYGDLENKPFIFEHCWLLLKDEPKWQETLSNKKQKRSNDASDEPINLGDDELSTNTERPIGIKAAKKIQKSAGSSSSAISDEILQERLQIEKAKYEQRNRALLEQEKTRELKQKKIDLKEKEAERRWELEVMTKDFQDMSPMKVEYWQNEKRQIMAKKGFNF